MRVAGFELDRSLSKIGQPIDREEWLMTPQTVNAYYHPLKNEIVFPRRSCSRRSSTSMPTTR